MIFVPKTKGFSIISVDRTTLTYNLYASETAVGYSNGFGMASFDFDLFLSLWTPIPAIDLGGLMKLHYARFNLEVDAFKTSHSRFAPSMGVRTYFWLVPSLFSLYVDVSPLALYFDSGAEDQYGVRAGIQLGGGFSFLIAETWTLGVHFLYHSVRNSYTTLGPSFGVSF